METTFGPDSEANGRGLEGTHDSWNPDLEEEDTEENRHKDIVVNTPPRPTELTSSREVVTAEDLGRSRGDTQEGMDRTEPGGPPTLMKRGNTESPRVDTPGLGSQQPSDDMPPLSQNLPSINHPVTEPMRTRYGRVVKKPIRFQD